MTFEDVLALAESRVGLLVFILLLLWVGAKENPLWVYGKTYRDAIKRERESTQRERERAEEWKEIATGGLHIAEAAVTKMEQDK